MREIRLLQITAKLLQIKWQHDKEKNASCYGERQIEAEMDIRAKQDESIAEARGIAFWSEAALCRSTFFFLAPALGVLMVLVLLLLMLVYPACLVRNLTPHL